MEIITLYDSVGSYNPIVGSQILRGKSNGSILVELLAFLCSPILIYAQF